LRGARRIAAGRPLSNDVPVSDVERSEDVNGTAPDENGVLANLPRARPQRSSARRVAARARTASSNGASGPAEARPGTSENGAGTAVSEKPAARKRTSAGGTGGGKAAKPKAAKSSVAPIGESAASASAKASAASAPSGAPTPKTKAKAGKRTPAGAARAGSTRRRARPVSAQEPAPRQGFESESDAPTGSIQPPGGVELVASAAELVGELAKAGLSRSERLLKDFVSRLPLS
jgi:hypothetical protein